MSDIKQRAKARKERLTMRKVDLHDETSHHSFHFELNTTQSWELLHKMSMDKYEKETGKKAPIRVDKSVVRKITLDERYS